MGEEEDEEDGEDKEGRPTRRLGNLQFTYKVELLTVKRNGTEENLTPEKWLNLSTVFSKMISCVFGFQSFAIPFRIQGI